MGKGVPLQWHCPGFQPHWGQFAGLQAGPRTPWENFCFCLFHFFFFDCVPFVGDSQECRDDVAFPPTCGPPRRQELGIQFLCHICQCMKPAPPPGFLAAPLPPPPDPAPPSWQRPPKPSPPPFLAAPLPPLTQPLPLLGSPPPPPALKVVREWERVGVWPVATPPPPCPTHFQSNTQEQQSHLMGCEPRTMNFFGIGETQASHSTQACLGFLAFGLEAT